MTHPDEGAAKDRLWRAALNFEHARLFFLTVQQKTQGLPTAQGEAFWNGQGREIHDGLQASAKELVAAFTAFSAAGLTADASDWRQATQAKRCLKGGAR
jgi:hypothetical protein